MKTTKVTSLVGLMLIASSAFAANIVLHGAEYGGDGGGGVVVPVPTGFGEQGTLLVTGTPGAGQTSDVYIINCQTDANGEALEFGCDENNMIVSAINKPIGLNPGSYWLAYSNSWKWLTIRVNQENHIELSKIQVGEPTQTNISFSVFVDYTNLSMQDEALRFNFSMNSGSGPSIKSECKAPSSQDLKACDSLNSGNYYQLQDTTIKFDADGAVSRWVFDPTNIGNGGFDNPIRYYITDPTAGQFVSVFPGVYGIEFKDKQNGQTKDQYGIKVE